MENVKNSTASVADMLALDALPEDVKAVLARVYGDMSAPGMYTEEAMEDAYTAGWEDCAETIETPYIDHGAFKRYMKSRKPTS